MWVMLSGKSLANPKSPIFGLKSLSISILLALMSLCTICGTSSSWRNARPVAVPTQIADLFPQSSLMFRLFEPTNMRITNYNFNPPLCIHTSISYCTLMVFSELPNNARSRLLFSTYSYTKIRLDSWTQHPNNSTRFGCLTFVMVLVSVKNSRNPCFDWAESVFTATSTPLFRVP